LSLLLDRRANMQELVSANGKSPLAIASELGHIACVHEMLHRGAPLEQPNADGSTPLMCAAHHGEAEIVAYLLNQCSPVDATDGQDWTALVYAVNAPLPIAVGAGGEQSEKRVRVDGIMGARSTTELLLLHKADPAAQTAEGLSALVVASSRDRPLAVRQLLECRADVNMTSLRGQSALLMAAAHNLPDVVKNLLVAQAEVNHANVKKESALSIAERRGYKDIAEQLKKAGATSPKEGRKKSPKKKK